MRSFKKDWEEKRYLDVVKDPVASNRRNLLKVVTSIIVEDHSPFNPILMIEDGEREMEESKRKMIKDEIKYHKKRIKKLKKILEDETIKNRFEKDDKIKELRSISIEGLKNQIKIMEENKERWKELLMNL